MRNAKRLTEIVSALEKESRIDPAFRKVAIQALAITAEAAPTPELDAILSAKRERLCTVCGKPESNPGPECYPYFE